MNRVHPVGRTLHCFDLFDTLVARSVAEPADIFTLLDYSGDLHYRWPGLRLIGFKRIRRTCERLARSRDRAGREDIDIFDVYRYVGFFVKRPSRLLKAEIRLELAGLRPLKENVALVGSLLEQGEACCVISDMYLPAGVVRRIVREIVGQPLDCFVSSDLGVTKASGKLFSEVSRHYGVPPTSMRHHGDNIHSDYHVPKSLGIEALHLPRESRVLAPKKTPFDCFHPTHRALDIYESLGYHLVGPLVQMFAEHILKTARALDLDRVVFVARDGYLLKRAFDELGSGIESWYVRVSRSALYVPSFACDQNPLRFFDGKITAREFFQRLGYETPLALEHLQPAANQAVFMDALASMGFHEHAQRSADDMRAYLRKNGFEGRIGLVDIGWQGSSQDVIEKLLPDCEIDGIYFGTMTDAPKKIGFYFHQKKPFKRHRRIDNSLAAFEFIFTEPVQSVTQITRTPGSEDFVIGFATAEDRSQLVSREAISRGFDCFAQDFQSVRQQLHFPYDKFRNYIDVLIDRFLDKPSEDTLRAFSELRHARGFGSSEIRPMVAKESASLRGYMSTYWKSGYASTATGSGASLVKLIHQMLKYRIFFIPANSALKLFRKIRNAT